MSDIDTLRSIAAGDSTLLSPHEVAQTAMRETDRLKAQLASITQATNCARCGVFKHTPARVMDGYICAGCLEKAWHKTDAALRRAGRIP